MHFLCSLALVALLGVVGSASAERSSGRAGEFDYYAVALSWSPSFCATQRDPDQCAPGRQLGFVLHGLWPQYEAGYPQDCSTAKLPQEVRFRYERIFPSPKLIGHEWRKHGTCSGLSPDAYFALSDRLKQSTVIPPAYRQPAEPLRTSHRDLVRAFKAVNPGLPEHAVLPFCSAGGRFLREVHACFDKGGRARACSEGQVKRSFSSCRQSTFLVQSVR